MPEFYTIFARKFFSLFLGGQASPISYAYAKDLANIFRTLPGPGEFQELAPPLVSQPVRQSVSQSVSGYN